MISRVGANTQIISTQQNKTQNVQKEEKIGRVEELKEKIQNGEYKIDLQKTAEAIAKTLL